mgnify:CR=1 FL=1
MKKINLPLTVLAIFITGSYVLVANAGHAWGKYHWDISTDESRSAPLLLGNNLTSPSPWGSSLVRSSSDWNLSVLQNAIVPGAHNDNCGPVSGGVEVCNGDYGDNGWLGIASIWATKGRSNHITQAVVKMTITLLATGTMWTGEIM